MQKTKMYTYKSLTPKHWTDIKELGYTRGLPLISPRVVHMDLGGITFTLEPLIYMDKSPSRGFYIF